MGGFWWILVWFFVCFSGLVFGAFFLRTVLDSPLFYKEYLKKVRGNSPICTHRAKILFSRITDLRNKCEKGKTS